MTIKKATCALAADSCEALAIHVAAIMAHPLTPFRLFKEIGNFLYDESSEVIA